MLSRFIKFVVVTETSMVAWKARHGMDILRVSLGIVFIWFGVLKPFQGNSAAEVLAGRTIFKLTFGYVKPAYSMPFLDCWECNIGLGLTVKKWLSFILVLLHFQMIGTLLPLCGFPNEAFTTSIFAPRMIGQYIIQEPGAVIIRDCYWCHCTGWSAYCQPRCGFRSSIFAENDSKI